MREPDGDESKRLTTGMFRWRLLPLALIAAGFVAFLVFGGTDYLSFETLRDQRHTLLAWRDERHALAAVAFVVVYVLVVAFSLPGAVWMTIAGGFLFGTVEATLYVVIAATTGSVGIFLIARYALADHFANKAGSAVRKMEAGFRRNALSYLFVLRLLPVFPFWLVNLVPAILKVPLRTFVVATLLGIIPGSFVYAMVGNGLGAVFDAGGTPDLGVIFQPAILLPIVGLALLALLPIVYQRWKREHPD